MKKLKSDLRNIHEELSKFRYTNILVLLFIFLAGFIVSASINKPVNTTLHAQLDLPGCGSGPCSALENQQNPNNGQAVQGGPVVPDVYTGNLNDLQNQNNNRNPQVAPHPLTCAGGVEGCQGGFNNPAQLPPHNPPAQKSTTTKPAK